MDFNVYNTIVLGNFFNYFYFMKKFIFPVLILLSNISFSQVFYGTDARNIVSNASTVKLDESTHSPEYIEFETGKELLPGQLKSFLQKYYKFSEAVEWKLINTLTDQMGNIHNRYRLYYQGYQLHEGMFLTHEKNGKIYAINGFLPESIKLSNTLVISEKNALNDALNYIGASVYKWQVKEEEAFIKKMEDDVNATYYPKGQIQLKFDKASNSYRYAWVFNIYAHQPMSRADYFVDAQTGKMLFVNNKIMHGDSLGTAVTKFSGTKSIITDYNNSHFRLRESGRGNGIETYNMQTGTSYGSAIDFTDSDNFWNNINAQKDEVATDAHWGMEMTYDYYLTKYNRNSIDGNGFKLKGYVHYDVSYDNAFWNGQYMTFGDGNSSWQPLVALDIVGHEISHGLTSFTADLDYQDESGAMNEAYSDIFGTAIEHYGKTGNWLIGEDIGTAMRSMSNPKSKGDPDTYLGQNYYLGTADYGGVHTNSGVLNHWFYLTSEGGSGTNDNNDTYNVTGVGIDTAGAIAFRTLSVYLVNTSDYAECRFYSIKAAMDLYGPCSTPVQAATSAFYAVGIGNDYVAGVHADFNTAITSYCAPPASAVFQNLSNNGMNFYWSFGDGDTSHAVNPTHIYSNYGSFSVQLIADGGLCGSDTIIKAEYISVDTNNPCFNFMPPSGTQTVTSCSGVLFDDGGLSNYFNNTNSTTVIAPIGAAQVKLTFTVFDFESGYDYLKIYDGPNAQSPLIGSYDGNTLPNGGVITSTGSSICLVQLTDVALNKEGFVANYECILPSAPPVADFNVKDTVTCTGIVSFEDKSTNGPTAWEWDFGDGQTSTLPNPVHAYVNNGYYTVSLKSTNIIGNNTVSKSNIIHIDKISTPYAPSVSVCNGGNIDLIALNPSSDVVNWYNSATGTNPIYSGDTLSLLNITQSETYYTEIERPLPYLSVGKTNNGGGGGNLSYTQGLYFDVYQPLVLHSVNVYANGSGTRTISLKRKSGLTIGTKTFNVVSGVNTIILDFAVPVGTDFLMESTNLYRNNNNVNFPYVLPGYLSITKSTAGTDPLGYYYYFYDWKIIQPSCKSERVQVNAFVNTASPIADFSFTNNDPVVTFSDITQNQGSVTWNFGDNTLSVLNNPVHNYLQNGTYQVIMNVNNGCGTDSKTKTVTINMATGISNDGLSMPMKLYPNPTKDYIVLEIPDWMANGIISIFDYTGKLIENRELMAVQNLYKFNTSNYKSGIYLVIVKTENQLISMKFIVL